MGNRTEFAYLSRVVLSIDAARHIVLGLVMITLPMVFEQSVYNVIDDFVPIWVFGSIFILVGLYCVFGAARQGRMEMRYAFQASAMVTIIWTSAFIAAFLFGTMAALRVVIPFTALFAIDLAFVASSATRKG